MADKRVTLEATYNGVKLSLPLVRVTEVKESEEIDSDMIPTFDEAVPVPSTEGGYTIDISTLEARNIDEFIKLKRIIKGLKSDTGSLSIFETVKHKEGNFEVERHYNNVNLSSNEVTLSAEDLTARDLSFNAGECIEKVDNEEI